MKRIILFLAFVATVNFTYAQWQQTIGPGGGSINCFAPGGPSIFMGANEDGVLLLTNNGNSWTSVLQREFTSCKFKQRNLLEQKE